jgi:hypothetical protein
MIVMRLVDAFDDDVGPQVTDRLVGLASRNAEPLSSAAVRSATEGLADVGADRVGGLTQLMHVHESPLAVIDEPIDLVLDRLRCLEDSEMPVVVHARR